MSKSPKERWNAARLRRQTQLRRDKDRLPSKTTRMVGIEIFSNAKFETGESFHAETTMAESLGVNVKSVKRALPQLVAAGYVRVRKAGRTNVYTIILDDQIGDIMSPINGQETTPPPQNRQPKGDIASAHRGHSRPKIGDTSGPLTLEGNSQEGNSIGGDGGGGARARDPLGNLYYEILVKIDAQAGTPLSIEAPHVVNDWLGRGWSADVILAGVQNGTRSLKGSLPTTLRYFEKPIQRLYDELTRPLPKVDVLPPRQNPAPSRAGSGKPPRGHDATLAVAQRKAEALNAAERTTVEVPVATTAPVARAAPRPPAPPKPDPRAGQYEQEIAKIIGWEVLLALPDERAADLRERWKAGRVPPAELEAIKLDHRRMLAQRLPSANAGTG